MSGKRECFLWTSVIAAMAIALGLVVSTANAEGRAQQRKPVIDQAQEPIKRAPWEVAVGGMTREDRATQQFILSGELLEVMPPGAGQNPISVSLTQKDRADLAASTPSGQPMLIGVVKQIEPKLRVIGGDFDEGVTTRASDGSTVWAVTVTSPGAAAIRVHFTEFSLPAGVEMFFHDAQGQAHGPYTGKEGNGDFWTRSISSSTGVIQLRYGKGTADTVVRNISFTVAELAHIHSRHIPEDDDGGIASHDTWPCSNNASCLIDANCVSGTPADPAKDAIAKMEWISGQSVFTCTGGLLTDTVFASQIPYFLTANHCVSSSIGNMETWFNYTTSSCNGSCPHNILTGGAPPSDTIGFTVVATSASSDFTLGTLNQAPPAGAVFLGWNNSPVAFSNNVPLHRVSNANFGPQVYSQQDVDTFSAVCGGLPRGNFIYSSNNAGDTMGGSSGSPVVNANGEVVGQLFGCCGANCIDCNFNNNWTVDGAFAATWPSVEEFLDPPSGPCALNSDCDDELFCNGLETCDIPSGICQLGTPPNCEDGAACTVDSCNETTDQCDNIDDGNCEDGVFCNGVETCDGATGDCLAASDPCQSPEEVCSEEFAACVPAPGACCQPDGSCEMLSAGICDSGLGIFRGNGVPCDPPPVPACTPATAVVTCELSASTAFAGTSVVVRIFATDPDSEHDVGVYQSGLVLTTTFGSGTLSFDCSQCTGLTNEPDCGIRIDDERDDYIFPITEANDVPSVFCEAGIFGAFAIAGQGTIDATPSYLGEVTLDVSEDATPGTTFEVSAAPPGPDFLLSDTLGVAFAYGTGVACTLTVLDPGACIAPEVEAVGSRSLVITTVAGAPVGLQVTGDLGDPNVSCVSRFVQADGTLGDTPVFQLPADWGLDGTIAVRASEILPETTYDVQTVCNAELSLPVSATTGIWGDVNNTMVANLEDTLLAVLAFQGNFIVSLEAVDLEPCVPNGTVNLADAFRIVTAFQGIPYANSCPAPCP